MSTTIKMSWAVLPVALLLLWGGGGHAANDNSKAPVETFVKPGGDTYFALSIAPQIAKPALRPTDVTIVFDTSASQAGDYRIKGLAALDEVLANLTSNDRVRLFAVDSNMVSLTEAFVASNSPEIQQGVAGLKQRVPLGSTDMDAALQGIIGAYANAPADRARAVIYIGDGMSTAQLIATPRMQELVDRMVELKTPMICYGIGPRVDNYVLGTLANHTGGILAVDHESVTTQQAGRSLAMFARQPVVWSQQVTMPEGFTVYPKKTPPLRFDRDTVLIGHGKQAPSGDVSLKATVEGQPASMTWKLDVLPAQDDSDNTYLVELNNRAERDGGLGLPLAGTMGLQDVRTATSLKAEGLALLAQQATAMGNLDQAELMAKESLRLNTGNQQATSVLNAVGKARSKTPATTTRDMKMVNFQPEVAGEAAPPAARVPEAGEGDFVGKIQEMNKLVEGKMQADVNASINEANRLMGPDPAGATQMLKYWLDAVRQVPELSPDVRQQLTDRLRATLQEAGRQLVAKQAAAEQKQQVEAAQLEKEQMVRAAMDQEERTKQLMARFEGLMDERRYGDAATIARMARDQAPNVAATQDAVASADTINVVTETQRINKEAWGGFVDALMGSERAKIPFGDVTPIVYPDPAVWDLLTEKRKKYKRVDLYNAKENEVKILEALDNPKKPAELDVIETPLTDVIDLLKVKYNIPIQLDNKALTEAAIAPDLPVTKNIKGVSLRSALRLLLRDYDLTYVIRDEVLLITTKAAAENVENYGSTKVYPVADLVIPIKNQGVNGFGSVGGGSGMMGAGGGGGGGMGGGGMGGGGMGGGGMFAVPEDLKLSKKKDLSPGKASTGQITVSLPPEEVRLITLNLAPGADLQAAWDQYFSKNQESEASVRETVRHLMQIGRHPQVVALIQAAIKNNQAQLWMYEALGIALQLQAATPEEIERALLSGLDFSSRPTDLLHVARYLARSMQGNRPIEQRALKLFQQASQLDPTHPEAFVEGLALAQRLDDVEGIQWSTVGILSQAWPNEHRNVPRVASAVAMATFNKLNESSATKEQAKAYRKALDQALVRDCEVIATWTGDADIDLLMQEPTGTVCSFRTPRTTGGGVMLGDVTVSPEQRNAGVNIESYVCPLGFAGTYKMQLKRVWGKPSVDKVVVDFYAHRGTKDEKHVRKTIVLEEGEAVAAFPLDTGRRTEPLAEELVANAIDNQLAIGHSILAQQMYGYNSGDLGNIGGFVGRRGNLFDAIAQMGRNAVGYQPVIITLPEGANFKAIAVVSADRRYVRATTQPFFSAIPKVNTFNYATGSSGTSNGANAGGNNNGGAAGS